METDNHIGFKTLYDIRRIFLYLSPLTQMVSLWLINTFKPFDFSNIAGYSHDMPCYMEKFPTFHGDNAIGAREHCHAFMEHIIDVGI